MKKLIKITNRKHYPTQSPIENIIVNELLNYRGLEFETQHEVKPYYLDMAFPKYKLGFEIDGVKYHSKPWQVRRDQRRDDYLRENGWRIERIPAWFCHRHPEAAVIKVLRFIPGIEEYERYQHGKCRMLCWYARELFNEGEVTASKRIIAGLINGDL